MTSTRTRWTALAAGLPLLLGSAVSISRTDTTGSRGQLAGACATRVSDQLCSHGDDARMAPARAAGGGGRSGTRTPTGSSRIGCYGDGVSGPRVQAVYAYPSDRPNRLDQLTPYLRRWAAGVDTQFDHSAVQTGGHRHVRYVATAGPQCTLDVLPVALSNSDLATLTDTITGLRRRGLNQAARKYLIWADTSVLCGIATTYRDDQPGQANLNNGYGPQYARIDHPCWGYAEAHELLHTLGGVQTSAPHATAGGHCRDGADLMCYPDGTAGATPQTKACREAQQLWFDCNHDDYYSAFLAATWSEPAPPAAPPTETDAGGTASSGTYGSTG
jgi:hypothetical protein